MSNLNSNNILTASSIQWDEQLYANKTVLKKSHIEEIEDALDLIEAALITHEASTSSSAHGTGSAISAGFMSADNVRSLNNIQALIQQIEAKLATYSPSGIITAYDKKASDIKSGYVWCTGSSSTPDIRAKVVIGSRGDVGKEGEGDQPFPNGWFSDTIDGTEVTQKTVRATFQKKV